MIIGMHCLTYVREAAKARSFMKDVLGLSNIDAGDGWLIFALPPAEWGVHPMEPSESSPPGQPRTELHFMCDDVHKTVAELKGKGVNFTMEVADHGYGLVTTFEVPGAGQVGLYQPRHPLAISLNSAAPKSAASKPAAKSKGKPSKPAAAKKPAPKKKLAAKKPAAKGRGGRGR